MEKVLGRLGAGERPVIFIAPLINPHDEDLDRLAGGEFVSTALEEKIVPVKSNLAFIELFRFRTEVDFANLASLACVPADGNQKSLALAGLFGRRVGFQADVVTQGAAKKDVIPGSRVECRDTNIRIMLFDGPAPPVIVVRGVRKPVEKIWRDGGSRNIDHTRGIPIENGIGRQRENVNVFRGTGHALDLMFKRVLREASGP